MHVEGGYQNILQGFKIVFEMSSTHFVILFNNLKGRVQTKKYGNFHTFADSPLKYGK